MAPKSKNVSAGPIGGYKEERTTELTLRQKEILKLLKKSDFNSAHVGEKLKDSPTVRAVQVDLAQLEKYGLVKREGKARAMLWKLKK